MELIRSGVILCSCGAHGLTNSQAFRDCEKQVTRHWGVWCEGTSTWCRSHFFRLVKEFIKRHPKFSRILKFWSKPCWSVLDKVILHYVQSLDWNEPFERVIYLQKILDHNCILKVQHVSEWDPQQRCILEPTQQHPKVLRMSVFSTPAFNHKDWLLSSWYFPELLNWICQLPLLTYLAKLGKEAFAVRQVNQTAGQSGKFLNEAIVGQFAKIRHAEISIIWTDWSPLISDKYILSENDSCQELQQMQVSLQKEVRWTWETKHEQNL